MARRHTSTREYVGRRSPRERNPSARFILARIRPRVLEASRAGWQGAANYALGRPVTLAWVDYGAGPWLRLEGHHVPVTVEVRGDRVRLTDKYQHWCEISSADFARLGPAPEVA